MNQTETLRLQPAAALVTAGRQIGSGLSFSERTRGARLVSGNSKACYEPKRRLAFGGSRVLVEASREAPAQAELRPTAPGHVHFAEYPNPFKWSPPALSRGPNICGTLFTFSTIG
jgi:hypothetical protein